MIKPQAPMEIMSQAPTVLSKTNFGRTSHLKQKRRYTRPKSGADTAFNRHMSITNTEDQSTGYQSYFIDGTKSALEQAKMAHQVELNTGGHCNLRELVPAPYSLP